MCTMPYYMYMCMAVCTQWDQSVMISKKKTVRLSKRHTSMRFVPVITAIELGHLLALMSECSLCAITSIALGLCRAHL